MAITASRFRMIKGQRELDVCVCCGQGIRKVWVMSNGWTMGVACMKAATTDVCGMRVMTAEAFDRISTNPGSVRILQKKAEAKEAERLACTLCRDLRRFGMRGVKCKACGATPLPD